MLPYIDHNQLTPYYEQELRKNGHQRNEPGGYTGMGYWFYGYPAYLGTMSMTSNHGTAGPILDQAQPDADSKIGLAAGEAGAVTDGGGMGANATMAGV